MIIKKNIIFTAVFSGLLLFTAAGIYGQSFGQMPEFSDSELEMFINAVQDLEAAQINGNSAIESAIDNCGLTEERFFEIYEVAQTDPPATKAFPEKDRAAFDITIRKITEIQEKMQADMLGAVEESGLGVERFNIIMSQIQFNTSLQERIKAMLN